MFLNGFSISRPSIVKIWFKTWALSILLTLFTMKNGSTISSMQEVTTLTAIE